MDKSLQDHAREWFMLAELQRERAAREEADGRPFGSTCVYRNRARIYTQAGEALLREARTGLAHCSNCGGSHPNHCHLEPQSAPCRCQADTCPWCGD